MTKVTNIRDHCCQNAGNITKEFYVKLLDITTNTLYWREDANLPCSCWIDSPLNPIIFSYQTTDNPLCMEDFAPQVCGCRS